MIRTVWRKQAPLPDTETAPPQALVWKIRPNNSSRAGSTVVCDPVINLTQASSKITGRRAAQQRLDARAGGRDAILHLQQPSPRLRLRPNFRHKDSLAQHANEAWYRELRRVHGTTDTQSGRDSGMKQLLLEIGK